MSVLLLFLLSCAVLLPTTALLWLSAGNSVFNPHPGEWWAVNVPLGALLDICDGLWLYSISLGLSTCCLLLLKYYAFAGLSMVVTVLSAIFQPAQLWVTISILWVLMAIVVILASIRYFSRHSVYANPRAGFPL